MAIARHTPRWEWIGVAWKLFVQEAAAWCLIGFIFFAATVLFLVAILAPIFLTLYGRQPEELSLRDLPMFAIMGVSFILYFLVSLVINAGALLAAKEQLRGGKPSAAHIIAALPKLPALVGLALLVGVLVIIASLFCIIPGLIVGGLFYFTTPLLVMGNRSITQAMRESYEMVKQDALMFILFAFVNGLITGIGGNLCYVGLIVSYPLGLLITAIAYHETFEQPPAVIPDANQPPPLPESL